MSRTLIWTAVLIAVALVLAAIVLTLSPGQARGLVPIIYQPVPQFAFEPVPSPLEAYDPNPAYPPDARRVRAAVLPIQRVRRLTPPLPPRPLVRLSGHRLSGIATYYCRVQDYGTGACMHVHPDGGPWAAAGPALRAALGSHWRGTTVRICNGARCATAILADWCACGGGHVIDLYGDVMAQIDPGYPGNGGVRDAVVSW